MESRASDLLELTTKLQSALCDSGLRAKAAGEGLPTGLGQIDDVILLLQPLRLGAAENDASALESTLRMLAEKNFLTGTQAVDRDGVWAALVSGCVSRGFGFHAAFAESEGATATEALSGERNGRAMVSTRPKAHLPLANSVERGGQFTAEAIGRVTAGDIRVQWMGATLLESASVPTKRGR